MLGTSQLQLLVTLAASGLLPFSKAFHLFPVCHFREKICVSISQGPSACTTLSFSSSPSGDSSCCDKSEPTIGNDERSGASPPSSSNSLTSYDTIRPEILQPFPEAANPRYICDGVVGQGEFVVSREGGPTLEELSNENILRIVRSECTDLEVNTLLWKCLGYRFVGGDWTGAECFPKWRERFPSPPDLIGMQRIYEREVDQPSLRSNQALVRSVPAEFKQSLKTHLKPLGFTGFTYAELTPNKTRRAQCANWLLYYREQLFGVTLEELKARKAQKAQDEASSNKEEKEDWAPPVTEVF